MSDHRCSAMVHSDWRISQCSNPGKVKHGRSWFCGVHDQTPDAGGETVWVATGYGGLAEVAVLKRTPKTLTVELWGRSRINIEPGTGRDPWWPTRSEAVSAMTARLRSRAAAMRKEADLLDVKAAELEASR